MRPALPGAAAGFFVTFYLMRSRKTMTPGFLRGLNHVAAPAHRRASRTVASQTASTYSLKKHVRAGGIAGVSHR